MIYRKKQQLNGKKPLRRYPVLWGMTVLLFILLSGAAGWPDPLYQSSRFPTLFSVLVPVPRSPDLQTEKIRFTLQTDYTSVFMDRQSEHWELLTDMEITVVTPAVDIRLKPGLVLGISIPFITMMPGFFDGPLADYHKFGNFPDYGRSTRPKNEFACVIKKDGKDWFFPKTRGFHPGDTQMTLAWSMVEKQAFASTVIYTLKLPTGDSDHGFGSGGTDHGLSLLNRFTAGSFNFTLNPGVIVPSDPDTQGADIHYRTMGTLFAGVEYVWNPRWSYYVQLNTFTSPLKDTEISILDDPSVDIAFGFARTFAGGSRLSFSFCEDLSGAVPDFTVHAGFETPFDL
jgi:hypothetical protein